MLVLAVALIAVWARVVQTLVQPTEHDAPVGQVSGIVWGGRVFTTSEQLRVFLESRGLSYARWVKAHPYAFTGRTPATTPATVAAAERTRRPATTGTVASTTASSATSSTNASVRAAPRVEGSLGTQRLVTLLLITAALALALVATVAAPALLRLTRGLDLDPERRVVVFARGVYLDPERRLAVLAAGLAILVGLVIAYFIV
jgi:hypothetical protein